MSQFNPENKKTHIVKIKRNGKIYVYEGYSYYDKDKKCNLNKRKYLGILNESTGEIKPKTTVVEKLVDVSYDQSYGPFFVFNSISSRFKLYDKLVSSFDSLANDIITIAFSIATEDSNLYLVSKWQDENYNSYTNKVLSSPRISELLPKINFTRINCFFEEWINSIKDDEYLAFDITSISSYSKLIDSVEYGYNRDGEKLPQINLGMLYGENSNIPVYYQIFNGSIKDVKTIENLIKSLDDMKIKNCKFVMDKGFYSSVNNAYLYDSNHIFTIAVPFTNKWAKKVIENNNNISNAANYSSLHKCYYKKIDYTQNERKLNVHIYYNPLKKVTEEIELNNKVYEIKQKLEKVKKQQETSLLVKYTDEEIGNIVIQNSAYFDIEIRNSEVENCKTIDYTINIDKINEALKTKGYLIILTNDYERTSEEIITLYRNKEVVENAFDDIKNEMDTNRLNVHSDEATQGKIFLVFLSLIFVSYIRKKMKTSGIIKDLTYKEVIRELRKIKLYTYKNGTKTISQISATQKKILNALDITEKEIKAIIDD